ncbi:putative nucleotidyltransferase component of viral defense system [Bradyrhizobium sp. USDA 4516]
MIPKAHILEWAAKTPWPEERQVEQDLIICRALVAIFSDDFLRPRLAFRGGTALNKLFFSGAYRYSEDIDLVQTTAEPIGPTIDALRSVLDGWLGRGSYQPKMHSPKMIYKVAANDGGSIRLKVEINTREHASYFDHADKPFAIESAWFSGKADIRTFLIDEILSTKLRALLQRDKGRDVFDIGHALENFDGMDPEAVVKGLTHYLGMSGTMIYRSAAEERLFAKVRTMTMLDDMRALVPASQRHLITEEAGKKAICSVLNALVPHLPGKSWVKSLEVIKELGLEPLLKQGSRGHLWKPS